MTKLKALWQRLVLWFVKADPYEDEVTSEYLWMRDYKEPK